MVVALPRAVFAYVCLAQFFSFARIARARVSKPLAVTALRRGFGAAVRFGDLRGVDDLGFDFKDGSIKETHDVLVRG